MSSKRPPDTRTTRCSKCGSVFAKKNAWKHEAVSCCFDTGDGVSVAKTHGISWGGSLFCTVKQERVSMLVPEVGLSNGTMQAAAVSAGNLGILQREEGDFLEICRFFLDDSIPFLECLVKCWNPVDFVRISPLDCAIFEVDELFLSTDEQAAVSKRFKDFVSHLCCGSYCFDDQFLTIRYFGKTVYLNVEKAKTLTCIQKKNIAEEKIIDNENTDAPNDISCGIENLDISASSDVLSPPQTPGKGDSKTIGVPPAFFPKCPPIERIYRVTERSKILWIDRDGPAIDSFTGLSDLGGFQREKKLLQLHVITPAVKMAKTGCRMLLYGASGTGKTALLRGLQTELEGHPVKYFCATSVPSADCVDKITSLFQEISVSTSSVLLVDDYDFPAGTEAGQLRNQVLSNLIDAYCDRGVTFVLATRDAESLGCSLRRRFDVEVGIAAPSQPARLDILAKKVGSELSADDLRSIAARTHGYTPSDLVCLLRHASRLACSAGEALSLSHVERSLKFVRPSAMREIILEVPEVRWADIGGMEGLKATLRQIVEWPLKHPDAFNRLGITPLKGVLFYGPPGCCKTMAARALATESGMNFLSVKGPELFSKWVGESEKTVRELFARARAAAPSIVFFDEIDAIGATRGLDGSKSTVGDRVLAQLLTEMDGVEPLANVVIVAATNRPDTIDLALLRPGRFDRLIYMPLPDLETRLEILSVQFRKIPVAFSDEESRQKHTESWARLLEGFSGAEIAGICREAAMTSLMSDVHATCVTVESVEQAVAVAQRGVTTDLLKIYERFRLSRK